ncbi:MAG: PaaI family thioesterase [Hyphomicrobiaceae bacterium]
MSDTSTLQPANPEYAEVVRASFARQGMMRSFGARLAEIEPGRVAIELPYGEVVGQQQGLFHGGAIGALGDIAGGYAALSLMPAGSEVVTVEYKINFIRPAKGALLRAEGQVLRAGKSVTVARIDVSVVDGDKPTAVALLQATFMRVAATG